MDEINQLFRLAPRQTLAQALTQAMEFLESCGCFFGHGTDNAWDEAALLLFWAMGMDDDPGSDALSMRIDEKQAARFESAINTRGKDRIPAAYIIGEAWFCDLKFFVDRHVLVPRSPIAELIKQAYRPWIAGQPKRILDLCCGSGCIGIAAAMRDQAAEVVLSDLSSDALSIAQKNIDRYALNDRVTTVQGDLFENLSGLRFDLILSNPPYVDAQDIAEMPEEYKHEPTMGLGAGQDGLDIAKQIFGSAGDYLEDEGSLIMELGNSWVNLEKAYPLVPFTWIDFSQGGEGVCAMARKELDTYRV